MARTAGLGDQGIMSARCGTSGDRMTDNVYNPPHYKQGGIECIEAIQAALTEEEFRGYCKGNAMKYIWRERHKGGKESVEKAAWYLDYMTQCV
jgi:hypothetical protein